MGRVIKKNKEKEVRIGDKNNDEESRIKRRRKRKKKTQEKIEYRDPETMIERPKPGEIILQS